MRTAHLRIDKNDKQSLQRPAWTQADLHAYRHRYIGGKIGIIENYFVKSKGLVRK